MGLKLPNPWGIYDLYGNVYEWCLEDSGRYSEIGEFVENPMEPINADFKAARGGCWASFSDECRSAARRFFQITNPFREEIGLRVVCVENAGIS